MGACFTCVLPPGYVLWRQCSSENTECMLPRVCQCVPKQGADAAGACAHKKWKKKIVFVILMQRTRKLSSLSLCLCLPPSHSTAPDNTVQAEEGEQAVLDCLQPWHYLLIERPEYHFSWAPGVPGTKTVFLTWLDLKLWHKRNQEHCAENLNTTIRTTYTLGCFLAVINFFCYCF